MGSVGLASGYTYTVSRAAAALQPIVAV